MNDDLLQSFNKVEQFHWWWAGRQQLILNFLRNTQPKKILDIGCGTGETLTFINKNFPDASIEGVDLSPEAVKFTKKRGHRATLSSATKLPFKDNTFDIILLLDVIEHIKDDRLVLKEAKRVVKKNGLIIMTAPSLPLIWSAHDQNQGHFRRYTKKMVLDLVSDVNLSVEKLTYFNFFLSPFIIIIRLLSRLPYFKKLGEYDSKLNYQIAYNGIINSILKTIFIFEIKLVNTFNYPFGISIAAKLVKEN